MTVTLHHGDALDVLRGLADNSVDAVVTDPPYGLSDHDAGDVAEALACWLRGEEYVHGRGGFMGRSWDAFVPGPTLWREVFRVLKPGGHLLCFAGTRTQDLVGIAIRLAGFECRDTLQWLYGSGFPKSLDVGKARNAQAFRDWLAAHPDERAKYGEQMRQAGDNAEARAHVERKWRKAAGAEREVVGEGPFASRRPRADHDKQGLTFADDGYVRPPGHALTAPATDAARQWDGWGTALKPAHEPILVFRKPLVGTVAANVQQWGTGALHIEACRVGTADGDGGGRKMSSSGATLGRFDHYEGDGFAVSPAGRWPANLCLSHAPGCERVGTRRVRVDTGNTQHKLGADYQGKRGSTPNAPASSLPTTAYADADGLETVDDWRCVDGCAVKALAEQSGVSKSNDAGTTHVKANGWGHKSERRNVHYAGDTGTAARFFPNFEPSPLDDVTPFLYTAKASRREREAGLEGMEERERTKANMTSRAERENRGKRQDAKARNHHPTVKPLSLMRWLAKLITPPGGVVLDPFLGSGTTGMAATMEGFNFVGIEQDAEYIEIARRRIAWAQEQQPPLLRATKAVASSEWRVASEEEEATETVERGA